jgi:O-acetyl-ADP-ribose deacetylase (regulator of RNase III)
VRGVSGPYACPGHGELVTDLRELRRRGLIRIRSLSLPALALAARGAGLARSDAEAYVGVEPLVRRAVDAMDGDDAGRATQYLFGLVQGTVGRPTKELRERAAAVYKLQPETFRKDRERLLIGRVADEILLLCTGRTDGEPAHERDPGDSAGGRDVESSASVRSASVASDLKQALDHVHRHEHQSAWREHTYGPFALPGLPDGAIVNISVRMADVARIRGVEVVVSSENVFLSPAKMFSSTVSGRLRAAAEVRRPDGGQDVVADQLRSWMAAHHPQGGPAPVGTVVPTSPGRLVEQDVRRLLHAAVAVPRPGTNRYDVSGPAIQAAVPEIFRQARRARADNTSWAIALPLFGAGRGGLSAAESFGWIWPVLHDELVADPTWAVHFVVHDPSSAGSVLHGLDLNLDSSRYY